MGWTLLGGGGERLGGRRGVGVGGFRRVLEILCFTLKAKVLVSHDCLDLGQGSNFILGEDGKISIPH